jgi:Tautomerase enzyme
VPLVRIDIRANPDTNFAKRAGEIVYASMRAAINVPEHDNFQLLAEHDEHHFVYDPQYLGIRRTAALVVIRSRSTRAARRSRKSSCTRALLKGCTSSCTSP